MVYIDRTNGAVIPEDTIVAKSSAGLTVYQNGCWRFIPVSEIEENNEAKSISYTISSDGESTLDTILPTASVVTSNIRYYTYYFGLNSLDLSKKAWVENSAAISSDIAVNVTKDIKLVADYNMPDNTSIEFSIVDGNYEYPILPQSQKSVIHEKVFFNMEPRFESDYYEYYKDLTYVSNNVESLDIQNNGSLYTVSYTPKESAYAYSPKHANVKVKTILRIYPDADRAPQVNSVTLLQEG